MSDVGRPAFEFRIDGGHLGDDETDASLLKRAGEDLGGWLNDLKTVPVQLTSYADAFDWDRSEYTRSALADDRILKAKKLVLKDAALPPLFRLSARPGPLLVVCRGARGA